MESKSVEKRKAIQNGEPMPQDQPELFIETKKYSAKRTGLFEFTLILDGTSLATGDRWPIRRQRDMLNGAYLVGMMDACGQLGCKPVFMKNGEDIVKEKS